MSFEQAAIRIEREREYEELKAVIHRAFRAEKVEAFLKRLSRAGLRIRNWDAVLDAGVFEWMDKATAESVSSLYDALTISDQAQIRELYLFCVEDVDQKLRSRFHKIYQYY